MTIVHLRKLEQAESWCGVREIEVRRRGEVVVGPMVALSRMPTRLKTGYEWCDACLAHPVLGMASLEDVDL